MASKALNRPKQMRAPTEKGFLKSTPQKTQPKYFHSTQWKICTSKRKPQLDSSNSCVGVTSSSGGKVSAAVKMYVLFPNIYIYHLAYIRRIFCGACVCFSRLFNLICCNSFHSALFYLAVCGKARWIRRSVKSVSALRIETPPPAGEGVTNCHCGECLLSTL